MLITDVNEEIERNIQEYNQFIATPLSSDHLIDSTDSGKLFSGSR